jgi:membrane protein DedA with SNARE-associated domain
VLALLAAAENILPPLPADTAVAIGAFLSHRGLTTPLGVFLVVWIANSLGATAIYFTARRYGRRLFATPTGRRLITPEAVAVIEREYLRFGLAGIFVSRFLPGIRAVVPPFAGLVNLGPVRALVPIILASGIWYGFITWFGSTVGANWERIAELLADVNRGLALLGVVTAIAVGVWWYLRRRRAHRRRIWDMLWSAFGPAAAEADTGAEAARPGLRSAALLVLELAYLDEGLTEAERRAVESDLRQRWDLASPNAGRPSGGGAEARGRIARYAARIREQVAPPDRLALVERMWAVALASPTIEHDTRLMALAGDLLGFAPEEVAAARVRVRAERELLG